MEADYPTYAEPAAEDERDHMDSITLTSISTRIREMEYALDADGGPLSRAAWNRLTSSMPGWTRIAEGA